MKDGIVQWERAGDTITYIRSVKKGDMYIILVNRELMSLLSSDCVEVQGLPLLTVGKQTRRCIGPGMPYQQVHNC